MTTETVDFALKIDADAEPVAESAAALEAFRQTIEKSQSALANYRKSMSLLKGSSDEVADAKKKLRGAIAAEQGTITAANLGILNLKGSYDKLAKAQKSAKDTTDAQKKAVSAVGGPVKDVSDKFESLKGVLSGVSTGWGALAVSMTAGVAVVAIAAAGVAGLEAKLADFILHTADANRNLALQREAFSGSEANAKAWGHQIDWASEKVALTTAKLQDLVIQTEKTYRGTRISGDGMAHAWHAAAEAAGAGRDDTVAAMQEIIERGKLTGRTFIGWKAPGISELAGKGIDVAAVFKELGLTAAQSARGVVVSTSRMAEALDKVATNKFSDINAKKMLSLGAQWDRLVDNATRFTEDLAKPGGALEPLLRDVKSLADMFDLTTQSGQDLKKSVSEYGEAASGAFHSFLPDIASGIHEAIHLAGVFLDVSAAVIQFAQSTTGMLLIKGLLASMAVVVGTIVVAVGLLAVALAAVGLAFVGLWQLGVYVGEKLYGFFSTVFSADFWTSLGSSVVEGLVSGIEQKWDAVKSCITDLGQGIKNEFKNILRIGSPSKEFAYYGQMTGVGYQQGIEQSQAGVRNASAGLAVVATSGPRQVPVTPATASPANGDAPTASAAATSAGGGSIQKVEIIFNLPPGVEGREVKQQLESSNVTEAIEHVIRRALQASGVPTGAPAMAGG